MFSNELHGNPDRNVNQTHRQITQKLIQYIVKFLRVPRYLDADEKRSKAERPHVCTRSFVYVFIARQKVNNAMKAWNIQT